MMTLNKKYSPNNYIWPVFSIKNYIQDIDGWFNYIKNKNRRNKIKFFIS